MSPLDVAVRFHLPEIVAELLSRGAEHSGDSLLGQHHPAFNCIGVTFTPFSRFVIYGCNARQAVVETLKVMADYGLDINETDSNGYGLIMVALLDPDGELYIPEELIDAGARLDRSTTDIHENAASLVAQNTGIRRYSMAALEFVSPHLPDINELDTYGRNALHYVAIGVSGAAVEVLDMIKTLDADARTRLNQTALQLASTFGNMEVILSLHDIGANLELVESGGLTVLQMASGHRRLTAAEALMKFGAKKIL
jgi:hypothetical protein